MAFCAPAGFIIIRCIQRELDDATHSDIHIGNGITCCAVGLLCKRTERTHSMTTPEFLPLEGGCTCGEVRYRLTSAPMFVHCCHCRWCQRETGTAFALNAMIEADRVHLLKGKVEIIDTPSNSGKGQKIARCPTCRIAVWSNYSGAGDAVNFVRVGTLDTPDLLPPDIHIFTMSKQPWVAIPPGMPAVEEYYDRAIYWPKESLERRNAVEATRRSV
jgi:hypothetical protein